MAFQGRTAGSASGSGTILLVVNAVLLWAYTLGCHSCRSITGGRLKHFSKHPVRYWVWTQVSRLNAKPRAVRVRARVLLVIADFYVWLVASGTITDLRFFN